MSKICSIPISELTMLHSVYSENNPNPVDTETFIIPDYQRGYRWEADIHVQALLNDINNFMEMQGNKGDRYCLQPVVVTQSPFLKNTWEVIDGQQRLITLYLLMNALEQETFNLEFETRERSKQFLRNLVEENVQDDSEPDFYYMSKAWEKINIWLSKKKKEDRGFLLKFASTLLNDVNVIWYDVESNDRQRNINIFNRLNIGKIALTDSELIKALLLSKIKGKFSGREKSHELTLRQSEISNELYRMESELQKPQKWDFLVPDNNTDYESHMDVIYNLVADEKTSKNYSTYLKLEQEIISVDNKPENQAERALILWEKIKKAFACVNSWFCDTTLDSSSTIYHYVGFLLTTGICMVTELYKESFAHGRTDFQKYLEKQIYEAIKDIKLENLDYENDKPEIRKILLLFNILTCEEIATKVKTEYLRFPFDRYNKITKEPKGGGWSLEHIAAQKSEDPLKNAKAIKSWIADTLSSIQNIKEVTRLEKIIDEESGTAREVEITENLNEIKAELKREANLADNHIDTGSFAKLRNRIFNIFGAAPVHELANMALLSSQDNSALNNAIFPVKRDRIIELEKNGRFIPPCTRNVFLKFYSTADTQPFYWGIKDSKAYFKAISEKINDFKNSYKAKEGTK